ncbi:MAG TPA: SusC/RagA family TonB-linked outer membrane protein [Bacteroidales bacterium]
MRISLLLTLVTTLNVSAVLYSQDAKLNLSVKDKPLIDVIRLIEQQSHFRFFFSDNYQDLNNLVSLTANNNSINEVLADLLKNKAITYRLLDNNIIVITPSETLLQQKITGTITDASTGEPLTGVSVSVEGTTQGVISDANGNFSIDVPGQNSVLVFTYMGYNTERIQLSNQTTINVSLVVDIKSLQEVVVTALGIKRDKKALSYASQQLSEDEISQGHNMNFANSLSGRVAGIDLRQSDAGAGGSTKIVLRGTKSFYGSSQPLFVIDGVPMANYQTSDATGMWGGHDSGDGISNINPDDIESITVLKGSNAAALYGSQGSNGVIIINTKKGVKGKTRVEISSSTSFQTASILPKLQTSYGQTAKGADDSWGAKGSYANPVDGFFRTGLDLLNTVSISGGNETTSAYLSYANSQSQGIMPTNHFNKNNLTFSQTSKFFKNLEVSSNIMLTDQMIDNKVQNGYYFNPLTGLYLFPRGLDFNNYKNNYQVFDKNLNMYTQNWFNIEDVQENPYWILNNDRNTEATKRIYGSLNLNYKISAALSVQARGNYDYTNQITELKAKAGTSSVLIGGDSNGRWEYSNLTSTQQYADLILTYNKDFGGNFDVQGVLGTSYQKRIIGDGQQIDTKQNGLVAPNEFYLNNVNTATNIGLMKSVMTSRDIKESVFANLSVGYKKSLYLDMSGRNEWSSALAVPGGNDVSYFYPSIGLSAIISQMIKLPQAINFAKVRTSYAYVGKEIPAFMTIPENTVNDVDVTKGIVYNPQIPYRKLKPEMQKSIELGAEMRFFDSRAGFDVTYYNINNDNEFLQLAAPTGSGYKTYFVNAGKIKNTGVEVTLTFVPVKSKNITWTSNINYALNRNKILKLDPTLKGQYSNGLGGEGYDMTIVEGGSIGDIYVAGYKRDTKGNVIIDADTLPERNPNVKIGSANPNYTLGWNNTITYKNFSFSFLIDGKFGGKFVDMTEAWYDKYGLSQRSADARNAGYVLVNGVTEAGTPISEKVSPYNYYNRIGGRNSFVEPYVYDATNIRLRQVVLTYNVNLHRFHVLFNNASVSLIGRNLFFFYRPAPFDPDNTVSTGINSQSMENFCLPPTRSIGFNIKLNF